MDRTEFAPPILPLARRQSRADITPMRSEYAARLLERLAVGKQPPLAAT